MKLVAATFFAVAVAAIAIPVEVVAQSCNHSWQTARDGSSCGDRAADRRPGGR